MWRDRTNLFISYRQSYSHHPQKKPAYTGPKSNGFGDTSSISEDRRGLLSPGAYEDDGDAIIEMDLLPPRWLDIQDEVTEYLGEVAAQTRKLEQLHQKHVLPGFDDEDVKKREEREIEQLTQTITRKFQDCQKAIKRIDVIVRDSKKGGIISSGEETMATNLKISLASRVGEVSSLFRKKQSAYLKKMRSIGGFSTPLDRSSTPVIQNPYMDPSMIESETDRSFSQSTLQQTKQQRLVQNPNDTVIEQREKEIDEIAQGIIELANIFQELQTMVIDQGSMLDRIDFNVERMAVEVKAADKELTVATGYQRKSIKRKIILLLLILVAGMFILLGLKLSSRGKPKHGPNGGHGGVTPNIPVPEPPPPALLRRTASSSGVQTITYELKRDWRRRKRRAFLLR